MNGFSAFRKRCLSHAAPRHKIVLPDPQMLAVNSPIKLQGFNNIKQEAVEQANKNLNVKKIKIRSIFPKSESKNPKVKQMKSKIMALLNPDCIKQEVTEGCENTEGIEEIDDITFFKSLLNFKKELKKQGRDSLISLATENDEHSTKLHEIHSLLVKNITEVDQDIMKYLVKKSMMQSTMQEIQDAFPGVQHASKKDIKGIKAACECEKGNFSKQKLLCSTCEDRFKQNYLENEQSTTQLVANADGKAGGVPIMEIKVNSLYTIDKVIARVENELEKYDEKIQQQKDSKKKEVSLIINKDCLSSPIRSIESIKKLKRIKHEIKHEVTQKKKFPRKTSCFKKVPLEKSTKQEGKDVSLLTQTNGSEVDEYTPKSKHKADDDQGSMSDDTYENLLKAKEESGHEISDMNKKKLKEISQKREGCYSLSPTKNEPKKEDKNSNRKTQMTDPSSSKMKVSIAKRQIYTSEEDDYTLDDIGGGNSIGLHKSSNENSQINSEKESLMSASSNSIRINRNLRSLRQQISEKDSQESQERSRVVDDDSEEEYEPSTRRLSDNHSLSLAQQNKIQVRREPRRLSSRFKQKRTTKRKKTDPDDTFDFPINDFEEEFLRSESSFKESPKKNKKRKKKEKDFIKITAQEVAKSSFKIKNKRNSKLHKEVAPEIEEIKDKLIKSLSYTIEEADVNEWVSILKKERETKLSKMPEDFYEKDLSEFGIRKQTSKRNKKALYEELFLYTELNIPPAHLLKS
ncbi:unnamed protein product [Moneuplotes crassus]|uniref:Uncharacterized protein n=1 Tax=Euplotes crassus TaxID=5936 RepID=A0AAD2DC59_EUPCR|nr:unnamed protein product [Moneuplotes crassus]